MIKINKFIFTYIIFKFCAIVDYIFIWLLSKFKNVFQYLLNRDVINNRIIVLLIIFSLGILIRLFTFYFIPFYNIDIIHGYGDSLGYYLSAVNGVENGHFSTFWPPGFPFFISIFYIFFGSNSIPIIISVLIVINVLCGLIAYYISLKLFRNNLAALLSFLFICIQPSFVIHSPQFLSDSLSVFIFAICIYYIIKDYKKYDKVLSLVVGLLVGILILIRPNYIFLGISFLFLVIISNLMTKIKIKKLILFTLGLFLIITPWLGYTEVTIGAPVISTNGGINLLIGNNINSTGRWMEGEYIKNYFTSSNPSEELEQNNEGYKLSLDYVINSPYSAISLYIKKGLLSIFTPYAFPWDLNRFTNGKFPYLEYLYIITMNIGFLVIELIGLRGIILFASEKQFNHKLALFFILLILLIYSTFMIFFVEGRFFMPLIFIYIILGSNYIARMIDLVLNSHNNQI